MQVLNALYSTVCILLRFSNLFAVRSMHALWVAETRFVGVEVRSLTWLYHYATVDNVQTMWKYVEILEIPSFTFLLWSQIKASSLQAMS